MNGFIRSTLTRDIQHAAGTPSRDSKGRDFRFPMSSGRASDWTSFPESIDDGKRGQGS